MSSISDLAERTSAAVGGSVGINASRLRTALGRWLMFGDYGATARRHMAVVWSCVLACVVADVVLLLTSRLSFASSNWAGLLGGIVCCVLAGAFIAISLGRLCGDASRPAAALRAALSVTELLARAILPIGALLTAGVTLSYLITAADLPLQDALLARIDRALGFHWLHFLRATNSSPVVATLLTGAYQTIGPVSQVVIIWLGLSRRCERLAELLAVLGLSTVALCAGMFLVPAAGAFVYYQPGPQDVANFGLPSGMWSFSHAFAMLRNGSLSVIDLSALQGVVSFPSFHTMLGVMTIYAVRDTRWLMLPVLVLNGGMFISTLPMGGHHLVDVLAGAGLTIGAIMLVRRPNGLPVPRAGNR